MTKEPLPRNYDYRGHPRLPGYVRGVTSVRCRKCNTTGRGEGRNAPWCDDCGGYGCVPPQRAQIESAKVESTDDGILQEMAVIALGLDNL